MIGADTELSMASSHVSQSHRVFRFGPFELSEREGELRKNGAQIRLQDQPLRVLVELLANAGTMVTREHLQQKLWSADTFVDFDVGLNTAIRKLRQALGDDSDNPRYIETLAKRGYRFIGTVEIPNVTPSTTTVIAPTSEPSQQHPGRRVRLWMLVLASLVIAGAAILQFVSRKTPAQKAQPRLVPLTTYAGREYEPALAPDGNRVAFAWSGPCVDQPYCQHLHQTDRRGTRAAPYLGSWGDRLRPGLVARRCLYRIWAVSGADRSTRHG